MIGESQVPWPGRPSLSRKFRLLAAGGLGRRAGETQAIDSDFESGPPQLRNLRNRGGFGPGGGFPESPPLVTRRSESESGGETIRVIA